MGNKNNKTVGILLLNLGGPDSLNAVKPFLFNLFSDREIIRLGPSFLQKPVAYLISSLRSKKTEDAYRLIGGKSPICDTTTAQAKALEEELNKLRNAECELLIESNRKEKISEYKSEIRNPKFTPPCPPLVRGGLGGVKVFIAMRYWHPLIEEVIPEIHKAGIRRLIVLSLYPQYSLATTGSSLSKLNKVISKYPIEIFSIKSWYDHPLYIDALVEKIKKGMNAFSEEFISKVSFPLAGNPSAIPNKSERLRTSRSDILDSKIVSTSPLTPHDSPPLSPPFGKGGLRGGDVHVLFSAHSLPVKFIEEGDPYVEQINGTINEVTKKIAIQWSLSYQSKSGPVKWLEPSTDKMIEDLAHRGIKKLLVVPISFVSDHIETLYEIDILYKNMAETLGITLKRVESLNIAPIFISALADIVQSGVREAGWAE